MLESIAIFCVFLTSNFIFIFLSSDSLEVTSSINPILNTLFPLIGALVSVSSGELLPSSVTLSLAASLSVSTVSLSEDNCCCVLSLE